MTRVAAEALLVFRLVVKSRKRIFLVTGRAFRRPRNAFGTVRTVAARAALDTGAVGRLGFRSMAARTGDLGRSAVRLVAFLAVLVSRRRALVLPAVAALAGSAEAAAVRFVTLRTLCVPAVGLGVLPCMAGITPHAERGRPVRQAGVTALASEVTADRHHEIDLLLVTGVARGLVR